jgi:hypothetical protein
MEKITINGKSYKYGGWAACAYKFMLLSNELESESNELEPTVSQSESNELEPTVSQSEPTVYQFKLIQIFKKSKELRGRDFLGIVIKKMVTYLQNYDTCKNGYIPEITAEFLYQFANSDSMQIDIEILINIIQAMQKIYLHLKIKFIDMDLFSDLNGINIEQSIELNIALIEKLHIYLIYICENLV